MNKLIAIIMISFSLFSGTVFAQSGMKTNIKLTEENLSGLRTHVHKWGGYTLNDTYNIINQTNETVIVEVNIDAGFHPLAEVICNGTASSNDTIEPNKPYVCILKKNDWIFWSTHNPFYTEHPTGRFTIK